MVSAFTLNMSLTGPIVVLTMIGVLLPMKYEALRNNANLLNLCNMFAAGVFIGVSVLHLVPTGIDAMDYYERHLPTPWNRIPVPLVCLCVGMWFMVLITKLERTQDQTLAVAVATTADPECGANLCLVTSVTPHITTGRQRALSHLRGAGQSHHHEGHEHAHGRKQHTHSRKHRGDAADIDSRPPAGTDGRDDRLRVTSDPVDTIRSEDRVALLDDVHLQPVPDLTPVSPHAPLSPRRGSDMQTLPPPMPSPQGASVGYANYGTLSIQSPRRRAKSQGKPSKPKRRRFVYKGVEHKCGRRIQLPGVTESFTHQIIHERGRRGKKEGDHARGRSEPNLKKITAPLSSVSSSSSDQDVNDENDALIFSTEETTIRIDECCGHDKGHTHHHVVPKGSSDTESHEEHGGHHDHLVHHHSLEFKGGDKWMPIILAMLFSIHSFTAGLAMGVQTNTGQVISMGIAVISHKWVEALSVGTNFSQQQVPFSDAWPALLVYFFMAPAGVVVGALITDNFHTELAQQVIANVLMFAAGSFLHIGISHTGGAEARDVPKLHKTLLVGLGIALMAAVTLFGD